MDHDQWDDLWTELSPLRVPAYSESGARLDAGGFVFGERFDTLLRLLSEDYLRAAWDRLSGVLRRHAFEVDDLSRGWLHGGVTRISGLTQPALSDFTGWTSLTLDDFDRYSSFKKLDDELKSESPVLRCACSYQTAKWRIAPDDFPLALKLIEALWTDEASDWSPGGVLLDHESLLALNRRAGKAYGEGDQAEADRLWTEERAVYETTSPAYRLTETQGLHEPWRRVAAALHERDQQQLRDALAEARSAYSPVGYRLLVRGYSRYLAKPLDGAAMLPLA